MPRNGLAGDLGVVFGLSGIAVGLVSLVYARTQAVNAQRQADAAHRGATIEIQNAMMQRLIGVRTQLIDSPPVLKEYFDVNPTLRELYRDTEQIKSTIFARNALDSLQDVYFLRKRSLVDDHHWRSWISGYRPIARMPLMRAVFENALQRDALDPEFAAFFERLLNDEPAADPGPHK